MRWSRKRATRPANTISECKPTSRRARPDPVCVLMKHVMPVATPPTRLIDFPCNARLASPAPCLLPPSLSIPPRPSPRPPPFKAPQHKACRCHTDSPLLPPDNTRVPPSIPVRSRHAHRTRPLASRMSLYGHSFLGLVAVYGII